MALSSVHSSRTIGVKTAFFRVVRGRRKGTQRLLKHARGAGDGGERTVRHETKLQ
jgi:hypothetical protein